MDIVVIDQPLIEDSAEAIATYFYCDCILCAARWHGGKVVGVVPAVVIVGFGAGPDVSDDGSFFRGGKYISFRDIKYNGCTLYVFLCKPTFTAFELDELASRDAERVSCLLVGPAFLLPQIL